MLCRFSPQVLQPAHQAKNLPGTEDQQRGEIMTIIIIKMLMSLTMIMHEDETHHHQDVDEFDNDYALG